MNQDAPTIASEPPQNTPGSLIPAGLTLPSNEISSTVFRFVSVRGPRNVSADRLNVGFIPYTTVSPPSQLFTHLASIARIEQLSGVQRLSAMKSAVNSFKTTAAFYSGPAQLRAAAGGLWDVGEWLTGRASSLTQVTVRDHLPDPVAARQREIDLSGLWDNLFVHLISGGGTELRQRLIEGLRAEHFLRHYRVGNDIVEEPVLRRLAAARPVLPAEVFPLPRPDAPASQTASMDLPDDGVSACADARGQEATDSLEQVRQALGHLRDAYALQLEQAAARQALAGAAQTPAGPVTTVGEGPTDAPADQQAALPRQTRPPEVAASLGVVTSELLASVPDASKQVLEQYGIAAGQRVSSAINTLSAAESTLTTARWSDVSLTRRLYQVGGGLWVNEGFQIPDRGEENGHDPVDGLLDPTVCPNPLLGVADLRRVEQELRCYLPGEVAHIENILQGEHKDRTTRRLRRSEETFTVSTEQVTVVERDTQTTQRDELKQEVSKVITEETSLETGLTAGQYGPVHVEASLGYSTSGSSTESEKQALEIARSVTDRALQRVTETVREEQVTKLLVEFEETNRHELDNRGGAGHVVGLYRWVDKLYQVRVVNYGKRLMLSFMVPEPGTFHLWAMTAQAASATTTLEEPLDPRSSTTTALFGQTVTPLRKHTDVTTANYALWAAAYGAAVEVPPPEWRTFSATLGQVVAQPTATSGGRFAVIQPKDQIMLEPGYEAKVAHIQLHFDKWRPEGGWIQAMVGRWLLNNASPWPHFIGSLVLDNETGLVPVSLLGYSTYLVAQIEVEAQRTAAGLEAWQLKTFKAILDAYTARKAEYENALAEAKAQRGADIQGTNPLLNRVTVQNELKKACLAWLFRGKTFRADGVVAGTDNCHPPKIKADCVTWEAGSRARFMEQTFEWDLMTYLFYPYYWGGRCRWRELYRLNDTDPLFQHFLQAGMARVTVPVRPGFEGAGLYFLSSGQIWNGTDAPTFDDPLNLSITDELTEPIGVVEGDPWDVRIPTTLTVLQCSSGCVEGDGLPCGTAQGFGVGTNGHLTGLPAEPD